MPEKQDRRVAGGRRRRAKEQMVAEFGLAMPFHMQTVGSEALGHQGADSVNPRLMAGGAGLAHHRLEQAEHLRLPPAHGLGQRLTQPRRIPQGHKFRLSRQAAQLSFIC
jgi:hypothetical protein